MRKGEITWVSGPVVRGRGIKDIKIGEILEVGEQRLIGETIRIKGEEFTAQVYEPTSGLKPGDPITGTGKRLVAELGPGLLTNIIDGIGRPLEELIKKIGPYITRGVKANTLPRDVKWNFNSTVKKGDYVSEGDIIGTVQETSMITHKIMVPPKIKGKIKEIKSGRYHLYYRDRRR